MANEFDLDRDLKVEILLPASDAFIWGFSKWGDGGKWGASSTLDWVDLLATVSEIEITHGFDVNQGLDLLAVPSTANIEIYSELNNPDLNKFIRLGAKVRVQYRPFEASIYTTAYYGYISNFNIRYSPSGKPLVNIEATNNLQSIYGTIFTEFSAPAENTTERLNRIFDRIAISYPDIITTYYESFDSPLPLELGELVLGDYTLRELLEPIAASVFGCVAFQSTEDNDYLEVADSYYFELLSSTPQFKATNLTPSSTYEVAYDSLSVSQDSANLANQVTVQKSDGTTLASVSDAGSITLFGNQPYTLIIDYADEGDAFTFASRAVTKRNTRNVTISLPGINTTDSRLNAAAKLIYLGGSDKFPFIEIEQDLNGVNITTTAFVTRQTHNITPDAWAVTIETWKG